MKQRVTRKAFELMKALSVGKRLQPDAKPIEIVLGAPVFDLDADLESYDVEAELLKRYGVSDDQK